MSLNSLTIETLAISEVKNSIIETHYATPYIADNDKEPSWDGKIYLYNSTNNKNENFLGRIDVQVKGKESNNLTKTEITYPVRIVDLKNYLKDKGVIYFVVYIDKEYNKKIYYSILTPFKIDLLLKETKRNQKSKSIILEEFPKDKKSKLEILYEAFKNLKLQSSYNPNNLSINQEESFDRLVIPTNINNFFSNVNSEAYLYGRIKGFDKSFYPIKFFKKSEIEFKNKEDVTISIGDKVYYNSMYKILSLNKVTLLIGESLILESDINSDIAHFKFENTKNLRALKLDLEFILDSIKNKSFKINDFELEINQDDLKFDVADKEDDLIYCKKIISLLDLMGCNEDDLDISNLNESDWNNIHYLVTSIIDGNYIYNFKDNLDKLQFFNIGNFIFLIYLEKYNIEDKICYKLFNFFDYKFRDDEFKIHKFYDFDTFTIPSFLILNSFLNYQDWLRISNLDFSKCLNILKSFPINEGMLEYLNLFILNLIRAADTTKNIKREMFLNAAFEFNNFLISLDGDINYNNLINKFQIIKRSRSLDENEKEELRNILVKLSDEKELTVAAYLLLDQKEAAKIKFSTFSEDEKETFKNFPISYFFKN